MGAKAGIVADLLGMMQKSNMWERACSRIGRDSRRIFSAWNDVFASKLACMFRLEGVGPALAGKAEFRTINIG